MKKINQIFYYKGNKGLRLGLGVFGFDGHCRCYKILRSTILTGLLLITNQVFADEPSPFVNSSNPSTNSKEDSSPNSKNNKMTLEEFQEEQDAQEAVKMQFLNAIQSSFFSKKRNPQDNNLNIIYKAGDTPKIRLRYAMSTTFIFDKDTIAYVSLGDSSFFEVLAPTKEGYNLSNILIIKPLLIGVDTNLTVIGKSGKIYTFYLFSTHFTNSRNPALTVFISDDRKIGKIDIIPPEVKQAEKLKKLQELQTINKQLTQGNSSANTNNADEKINSIEIPKQDSSKSDNEKSVDYTSKEIDDGKFIRIGDESNHLFIDKSKIKKHYYQAPRKKRMWWSLWLYKKPYKQAEDLKAIDIFDDGKYTYFKYNREIAISKFPYPYKVIDGYDNPINSRVVGNYIIAEDVNAKWTLRLGEEYVCVQKIPSKKELDEERLQKAQQVVIPISDQKKQEENSSKVKTKL
ncbi:TrbG/VirB9 family P-type conjugative transfer protein [Helicobacter cappadocius]|uniref:TrbG/VirB9 family P-type conjugative transfer protein n=1 Tax=Helicobacter cappadocius TaxID=3063998 RepID=UPI00351F41A4